MNIFTVGHSNLSAAAFGHQLRLHKIELLVDVRTKPWSRFAQFGQAVMPKTCAAADAAYRYMGRVLGGENPVKPTSKAFIETMEKVAALADDGVRLAMMCSEGDPRMCHRAGKLSMWLEANRPDLPVLHILKEGDTIKHKALKRTIHHSMQWEPYDYG